MNRTTEAWKQELDLLEILKKHKTVSRLLKSKEFRAHFNKYFALNYGYVGPAWKKSDFKKQAQEILKKNLSIRVQIKEHKNLLKKLRKEQKDLEKRLRLGKDEKRLFKIARDFMYLKSYRIEVRHRIFYICDEIFKILARRFKVSISVFKFAHPDEILSMIENGGVANESDYLKRSKQMVYVIDEEKSRFIHSKNIKKFLNTYFEKIKKIKTHELKGQVAFRGKVSGRARIVRGAADNSKVKKGDILVAPATNPDVLPAMKKANAFVGDSGGITSHMAIVAREMKKPCVIATRFATTIFKDGDKIEVDAEKGIVRKI